MALFSRVPNDVNCGVRVMDLGLIIAILWCSISFNEGIRIACPGYLRGTVYSYAGGEWGDARVDNDLWPSMCEEHWPLL